MPPKDTPERTCAQCGNPLTRKQKIYCSPPCKHAATRINRTYTCKTCGELFHPNYAAQRYCGASCKSKATWAIRRGEQPSARGGVMQYTCKQCGKGFEDDIYNRRQYCSAQCHDEARRTRHPRECAHCGKTFMPTHRKDQRFCSLDCGFAAGGRRGRKRTGWNDPIPCDYCGVVFTPTNMRGQRFCSKPCGALARHEHDLATGKRVARRLRTRCHKTLTRAVVERDGAVCHICHAPIDLALSGRHQMGLTIDHVIPLARGGSHTLGNLKPAHRVCNQRKSWTLPDDARTP